MIQSLKSPKQAAAFQSNVLGPEFFMWRSSRGVGFIRSAALIVFCCLQTFAFAQERSARAIEEENPTVLNLREFESMTVNALRREFPRLPGMFSTSSSCRLPEYGPLVSVTLQLPAFYFTRPVLLELERRQKVAEEQARKIRQQIDRAAELINLKAREAALVERISKERNNKKKSATLEALENDLAEVRKTLQSLESSSTERVSLQSTETDISEVDLNKMILSNYQQMVQRVTEAMKNHLAENGPKIIDLTDQERVSINAHVRDNFLPNQSKSIVFVLDGTDILDFKQGRIDLPALRTKVLVRHQDKDQ